MLDDDTPSAELPGALVVGLRVVPFVLRASWCLRRGTVRMLAAMTDERVEDYNFASPGHEVREDTRTRERQAVDVPAGDTQDLTSSSSSAAAAVGVVADLLARFEEMTPDNRRTREEGSSPASTVLMLEKNESESRMFESNQN